MSGPSTVVRRYATRCLNTLASTALALGGWLAVPAAATAAPVFIVNGGQEGQGFAFTLGSSCYAITAGHVIDKAKGPVSLIDRDAYRTTATVLKVDPVLDLGLLEVTNGSGQRKLCASGNLDYMLRLDPLITTMRREGHDIWLDKISAAAGGLERMEMALGPRAPTADTLEIVAKSGADPVHYGRLPVKGDSGSSVWVHARARSEHYRYTRKGEMNPRPQGNLLGVFIAVEGKAARVVRSDRVHEFIFSALRPVRWSEIAIEPDGVEVTATHRGPFPARGREQTLAMSAHTLAGLSYEFDLGKRDKLLNGVELEFAPSSGVGTRRARAPHVQVETSQFRPNENAQWTRDVCRPGPAARMAARAGESMSCTMLRPRVARGVRLEIVADLSTLRRVKLLVEE